jgi:hypothetical protein
VEALQGLTMPYNALQGFTWPYEGLPDFFLFADELASTITLQDFYF